MSWQVFLADADSLPRPSRQKIRVRFPVRDVDRPAERDESGVLDGLRKSGCGAMPSAMVLTAAFESIATTPAKSRTRGPRAGTGRLGRALP
jgi:hypothetical protein